MNTVDLRVSVLMSCYNAERWLSSAIESVLAQTFQDFEFILINDGSNDNTWALIQSYYNKDHRIVPINKPNSGLADSLNQGIKIAQGQWIARLDADDICLPNRLELQLQFADQNPNIVLLGGSFYEIDEHGQTVKINHYPTNHDTLVRNLERLQRFFPHSSAFYKRSAIQQIGGGYNTRIKRAEDWDLWLRLSEIGEIACLDQTIVHIRKHADQISLHQSGSRQKYDACAGSICHFIRQTGNGDPSMHTNEQYWLDFMRWVEKRVDEENVITKREVWNHARSVYFSSRNQVVGALNFAISLIKSGYCVEILNEKIFGSGLCKRLAYQWLEYGPTQK